MISHKNFGLFILLILFALLSGFYHHDLSFSDELRESAIIIHMLKEGNYAIPMLGDILFVEKPPLYYLSQVLLLKLNHNFFPLTFVLRFGSLLWAAASLCGVFFLTQKWAILWTDKKETQFYCAFLALAIFASCNGFLANSIVIRTDVALIFFTILTALGFTTAYLEKKPSGNIIAALAIAGGFLTKGIIAIGLGGLIWITLFPFIKDQFQENKKDFVIYNILIPLFIVSLVFLGWIYFLIEKGGEAAWHQWFVENTLKRFTGGVGAQLGHDHPDQFSYYMGPFLNYSFPWFIIWIGGLFFFRKIIFSLEKVNPAIQLRSIVPVQLWVVIPLFILSIAESKRPIYLLPLLPFLAIATTALWWNYQPKLFKGILNFLSCTASILILSVLIMSLWADYFNAAFFSDANFKLFPLPIWLDILVIASGIFFFLLFRKQPVLLLSQALIFAVITVNFAIFPATNEQVSGKKMMDDFFSHQPSEMWAKTVSSPLTERTTGYLYTHFELVPKVLYLSEIKELLKHNNTEYQRAIIEHDAPFKDLNVPKSRIIATAIEKKGDKFNSLYLIDLK